MDRATSQYECMKALNNEAFWLVTPDTPYSEDTAENTLGDLTVSRLDEYLGSDFACYTNRQRAE